jgi:hypothetical protein
MADDISTIVTGDDPILPVVLTKDGATFTINPGAVIQASVTDKTKRKVLLAPTPVVEETPGSDWANSLVVVVFSSVDTSALTYTGTAVLEIQVDDNGKLTWFDEIEIVRGTIS